MFSCRTNLGDGISASMAPYFNQLLLPKAIVPQELHLNGRHLCFTIKDRQRNKLHWQRAHDTHGIILPVGMINKSCSCFDMNAKKCQDRNWVGLIIWKPRTAIHHLTFTCVFWAHCIRHAIHSRHGASLPNACLAALRACVTVSLMGAQRICKIQALTSHLKHEESFSNLLYGRNVRALCWKYTDVLSRSW